MTKTGYSDLAVRLERLDTDILANDKAQGKESGNIIRAQTQIDNATRRLADLRQKNRELKAAKQQVSQEFLTRVGS